MDEECLILINDYEVVVMFVISSKRRNADYVALLYF
jgi:hypothetical protein